MVGARQIFHFFRQITWVLRNNRALSKFKYQILHYLISIIKSKNISPSKNNFTFTHTSYLKACVFYQIFIFHQMTALQKQ